MTPASGGFTRGRLSQARPLAGLPPAHRAFQGHAAHLAERSATLSPNDSWGAWTPTRDYPDTAPSSIPRSRFMAHSTGLLGEMIQCRCSLTLDGTVRSGNLTPSPLMYYHANRGQTTFLRQENAP